MEEEESKIERWKRALGPERVKTGPLLSAVLGALFGEKWTDPRLTGLKKHEGTVLGQINFEVGYNLNVASYDDVMTNLRGLAHAALADPADAEGFVLWTARLITEGFEDAEKRTED